MRKLVSVFVATSLVAGGAFAQATNVYTKDGAAVQTAAPVAAEPAPAPAPVAEAPKHKAAAKHTSTAKHTAKKKAAHKKKAAKKHTAKHGTVKHVNNPAPVAAPVASPEPAAPVAPIAPGTTGQ